MNREGFPRRAVLGTLLACVAAALPAEEGCAKANATVRLASDEARKAAGIALDEVEARGLAEEVAAHAQAVFDASRTARIGPAVAGILRETPKRLGDTVAAGEVVLVVDAPALGEAKSECLAAAAARDLARSAAEREQTLAARSATSRRELELAEAELAAAEAAFSLAKGRLGSLGLSAAEVDRVLRERDGSSRLAVLSPAAGTVVEWDGVPGEMLDPARPVATVTDLTRFWVAADVPERDVARVAAGQEALFVPDADPARVFAGAVTWVGAAVDPRSRALPVRMEVEDPERFLKAHLAGTVRIRVRTVARAVVVPKAAVQWEGCCHMVFVPAGPLIYQGRPVRLGYSGDGFYEILSGLSAGEKVVTAGSFLLKTEVVKSSIGAG